MCPVRKGQTIRMHFMFVLLSSVGLTMSLCPTNTHYKIPTFGSNCKYRCNCAEDVQCNENNGECPHGCEFGWMGPACQYRNVAANKTKVGQFGDNSNADNATDGNMATCSSTNPTSKNEEQHWWVGFRRDYYIVGLVIYRPAAEPLTDIRIETINMHFSDTVPSVDPTEVEACARLSSSEANSMTEVMCNKPVLANALRIVQENSNQPLSLCEIQIYGGRLVSFNQPTSQSTTLIQDGLHWSSHLAVDGTGAVTAGNEQGYTCSQTNHSYEIHWWQLNLPTMYRIETVYVFGRLDSNAGLRGMYVNISSNVFSDGMGSGLIDYYLPWNLPDYMWPPPVAYNYTQGSPVDGDMVNLTNSPSVVICELLVFAECLPNKCGWDCTEDCMCNSVTTGTPRLSANCPYGCTGRWTGTKNKCNKECAPTEWGPFCNKTCGHCADDTPCDVTTGICAEGCKPSWKPDLCTEQCASTEWGAFCNKTCGHCAGDTPCDVTTGICSKGCKPTWKPDMCIEKCAPTEWGPFCNKTCGHCADDTPCDVTTGICAEGCKPSWKPDLCTEQCASTEWGAFCNKTCGHCAGDTPCDVTTGICSKGCKPTWKPDMCIEKCAPTEWGPFCNKTCGHCADDTPCDVTTGICAEGCKPSWKPDLCTEQCASTEWGAFCNKTCGHCACDTPCDVTTGICSKGCKPTWKPDMCIETITTSHQSGSNDNINMILLLAVPMSLLAILSP